MTTFCYCGLIADHMPNRLHVVNMLQLTPGPYLHDYWHLYLP
jgi:hypothetical protein